MKRKISMIIVGLLLILSLLLGATYAYWQLTRTQSRSDKLATACLNLDIEEESGTFGLPDSWPMSDAEGLELDGYTFTVKNNCDEAVNYIIGLDSLTSNLGKEYMAYENIKISLDGGVPIVYSSLNDLEKEDTKASKQVSIKTETVEANGSNTHTIKAWIKSSAPVTEQNKVFNGRVFIIGGQNVEAVDDQILAYGNVSDTEADDVNYVYNADGLLKISGTGKMAEVNFSSLILQNIIPYISLTAQEQAIYDDSYSNQELGVLLIPIIGGNYNGILDMILSNEFSGLSANTYEAYMAYLEDLGTITVGDDDTSIDLDEMDFFSIAQKVYEYVPEVQEIIMEEGITNISSGVFAFTGYDIDLTLPSTITEIEAGAFMEAKLNLDLSNCDSLQTISSYAFEGSLITSLVIPNSVKKIEPYAFTSSNLEEIILSTNYLYYKIEENLFSSCHNLIKVVIPTNVSIISTNSFENVDLNNLTLYFVGPQRTIYSDSSETEYDLSEFNVVWNYTE